MNERPLLGTSESGLNDRNWVDIVARLLVICHPVGFTPHGGDGKVSASDWATQVAAPVTTFLIIIGIVVVRGTTISQFRQKWIDDQRQDVATVLSYSAKRIGRIDAVSPEDLIQLDLARNRILLREKPDVEPGNKWLIQVRKTWYLTWGLPWGPEWELPLATIKYLRDAAAAPGLTTSIESNQITLIAQSRVLLKAEWNRTRNGELGYRFLLLAAASLTLISVLPAIADWGRRIAGTAPSVAGRSNTQPVLPAVVLRGQACVVVLKNRTGQISFKRARCLPTPTPTAIVTSETAAPPEPILKHQWAAGFEQRSSSTVRLLLGLEG